MNVATKRPRTGSARVRVVRSLHRVPQFARALITRQDDEVDRRLRGLLADEQQWLLLVPLAPYDRAHHLRIYELLRDEGVSDPDLLRAALLHDVGKADDRGRVRLAHRIVVVVLRRFAPRLLARLNRADLPGPFHGFYLGEHHARLGARLAERAGVSARTRDLIAGHERRDVVNDPELRALIDADERAIT